MNVKTRDPNSVSIKEAVRRARLEAPTGGEVKLRKGVWAFPDDHIVVKYDSVGLLPWVTMRFPTSGPITGVQPEQSVLIMTIDTDDPEWLPFVGARL